MKCVVIGNSAAGLSALKAFRNYDTNSPVTIISKEACNTYSRVLLPYYLSGKIKYQELLGFNDKFYDDYNAEIIYRSCVKILPESKEVILTDGTVISFDKLLIAAGSTPRYPPIENLNGENIFNLWTLEDALAINQILTPGKHLIALGSGFISLMTAWAAVQRGLKVTVVELDKRIMPKGLDCEGSWLLFQKLREFNVTVKLNTCSYKVERHDNGSLELLCEKDSTIGDFIVNGTGVGPNIGFIEGSNLLIDKGVLVNEFMETNINSIYAAGDIAQGPSVFGQNHVLHQLWSTAIEHGKIAGTNMANQKVPYFGSLNMNVTEIFGMVVGSIGNIDTGMANNQDAFTYAHGEEYMKIFFNHGVPRGALIVGSSKLVPLLGVLKPYIQFKKKLKISIDSLIKSFLESS